MWRDDEPLPIFLWVPIGFSQPLPPPTDSQRQKIDALCDALELRMMGIRP